MSHLFVLSFRFFSHFQLRSALDRIDELEASNCHLSKRVEKMKANRNAMLAQQWCLLELLWQSGICVISISSICAYCSSYFKLQIKQNPSTAHHIRHAVSQTASHTKSLKRENDGLKICWFQALSMNSGRGNKRFYQTEKKDFSEQIHNDHWTICVFLFSFLTFGCAVVSPVFTNVVWSYRDGQLFGATWRIMHFFTDAAIW